MGKKYRKKDYVIDSDTYLDQPVGKKNKQEVETESNLDNDNINLDHEFIIYRPVEQKDEKDNGWYILKAPSDEQLEEVLKEIPDESVLKIKYNNPHSGEEEELYIAKTTVKEQCKKTYSNSTQLADFTLFESEKLLMRMLFMK